MPIIRNRKKLRAMPPSALLAVLSLCTRGIRPLRCLPVPYRGWVGHTLQIGTAVASQLRVGVSEERRGHISVY